MILEQLGILLESTSLDTDNTGTPTAIGHVLNLESAYNDPGVGAQLWLVIKCTVAADYAQSNEKYRFILRTGSGINGNNINADAVDVVETPFIPGNDARVSTAGAFVFRAPIPMEINQKYLQVYKDFTGTSPVISVTIVISPTPPPSDKNRQVHPIGPMSPP